MHYLGYKDIQSHVTGYKSTNISLILYDLIFYDHNLRDAGDFNNSYKFTILEVSNPRQIDYKEHVWIQRLKCITPYGLNAQVPYGIPLLI